MACRTVRWRRSALSAGELEQSLEEQRTRVTDALQAFADNTLRHLREEGGLLSEGVAFPPLETRFRDDYTDPDPLLSETLFMYATLAEANGESDRANELRAKAAAWAPGTVWASSFR